MTELLPDVKEAVAMLGLSWQLIGVGIVLNISISALCKEHIKGVQGAGILIIGLALAGLWSFVTVIGIKSIIAQTLIITGLASGGWAAAKQLIKKGNGGDNHG